MKITDLTFTEIEIQQPVRRVVSLVPSVTESLFGLGMGDRLVGRTTFCVSPEPNVKAIEIVGGTKNPKLDMILALNPDLVLANKEENRREDIRVPESRPPLPESGGCVLPAIARRQGTRPDIRRRQVADSGSSRAIGRRNPTLRARKRGRGACYGSRA
jgi:hypothetical protein